MPTPHALSPFRSVRGQYPADDMPEFPARVLILHCVMKGLQWSVLALPVAPIWARVRKVPVSAALRASAIATPAAGLGVTLGMLGYKAANGMDADGVDDRAYRIARNEGQNTVDLRSARGAGAGALAGAALVAAGRGRGAPVATFAAAVSLGIAAGVLRHGVELAEGAARKRGWVE
jgi:hypothetical protein